MEEPPMPTNTKEFALETLSDIGMTSAEIKKFTAKMGAPAFSAIANFKLACEMFDEPIAWGEDQVKAFLIYINSKFYSAAYLRRQWNAIQSLGEWLDCPVTEELQADFELVENQGQELKDNKVPISKKILKQLCQAADVLFDSYNAALSKTLFVTAYGGYMRVSEYSRTSGKNGNKHNIRSNAVLTSTAGISITFHSDKTSKSSDPIKHRFVSWKRLPHLAKQAFKDYNRLRPRLAKNFFCREDGAELTRSYFLNLLDACWLMTRYRNLTVTPHSFRLGAASEDRLRGVDMREIEDRGRWGPKSKAIQAYTRQDLVVLDPDKLLEERPVYRRFWTHQRLVFISTHIVELSHDGQHPFRKMLESWYPELIKAYGEEIPSKFPDTEAINRMQEQKDNRASGKYLKQFAKQAAKRQKDYEVKKQTATKVRRSSRRRIKGQKLPWGFLSAAGVKVGISENQQVQTVKETVSSSVQTDNVVILTTQEFQKLNRDLPITGVNELPKRIPLKDQLKLIEAEEPTFRVQSLGSDMALTKSQIKARRRSDPDLQVSRISMSAKQRYGLRSRIRRRISKSYRDHKNNARYRYSDKAKGVTVRKASQLKKKSGSILRLTEFFFAEVLEKGKAGMPTWIEEADPDESDEEFEQRVIDQYRNKPPRYEQLLAVRLHGIPSTNRWLNRSPEQARTPKKRKAKEKSLLKQMPEATVVITPFAVSKKRWLTRHTVPDTPSPRGIQEFCGQPGNILQVAETPMGSPELFTPPISVCESEDIMSEQQAEIVRKVSRKIKQDRMKADTIESSSPSESDREGCHQLQMVEDLFESQDSEIRDTANESVDSNIFPLF